MSTNCFFWSSSGGLFDNVDKSKDAELAFKFAVQAINNQRDEQTDGLLHAGKSSSSSLLFIVISFSFIFCHLIESEIHRH